LGRTLEISVMMLPTIAIGFGVPVACLFYLNQGLNTLIAGIISGVAIFFAFILGVVTIEEGLRHGPVQYADSAETEKLNILRASQRATLEELDGIIVLLKEIRDTLLAAEKT